MCAAAAGCSGSAPASRCSGASCATRKGIEGEPGDTRGLGLLDIETEIGGDKRLIELAAEDSVSGCAVQGYEMHMGRTTGPGLEQPWLRLQGADGQPGPRAPPATTAASWAATCTASSPAMPSAPTGWSRWGANGRLDNSTSTPASTGPGRPRRPHRGEPGPGCSPAALAR
jgi:hypothetical protein